MTNYIERYWRDAKPEDAIKDPPMVARFRNNDTQQWYFDKLTGIDRGDEKRWICGSWCTVHCQVYDAPDPGEGWRLIDVENEQPQVGDEVLVDIGDPDDWKPHTKWEPISGNVGKQCIVRRRIAPAVTYVPFTWEDRKELQGRMVQLHWENGIKQEMLMHHFTLNIDGRFEIAKVDAEKLLKIGVFLDTGEPVGKKVQ